MPILHALTILLHLPPPDPLDDPQRPPPTLPEGDPPPHGPPARAGRAARFP
ncbi:hypothetical protein C7410_13460 [Paraburkholderia silvatlantica]|uniref:Uncharacterized protein n=1 Tax=Paraburkholderia silvatlantica TaxID=321895 RepID=A0A2V4T534_9BURK|nr:hypothetical protein C7410_13460 [Paraburkholderia silvatlantica]